MAGMKIKAKPIGSVKSLRASLKKGGGGATWLKRLSQEGGTVVRFLTEPEHWIEYYEFYSQDDKAYYPVSEGGPVPTGDSRPAKRFLANVVEMDENKVVAIVLPVSLVTSLMKKYDKYKTITDRDYELVREGSGKDNTTYEAIPEPPTKINLDRFDLLDLMTVLENQLPTEDPEDEDDEEDAPAPRRAGKKRAVKVEHEGEEDDDEDDPPFTPTNRKVKPPVKKPGMKKTAHKGLAKKPARR